MRHSVSRWLASVSLLLLALAAAAATRPHYGGTLRIEIRAAPATLDPAGGEPSDPRLISLLFDTLVVLDESAAPQPQLARGWQSRNDGRKWQFPLRPDVKLHDGSALTPAQVAASLKTANPGWRVTALDDAVALDFDAPQPHLLAELARPHNTIVVRGAEGRLLGTGPYRLAEWQPGRRAVLNANDEYWGGRPFLDPVQIEMGRSYRDQLMDLDLGRADVIELSPDQVRRAMQDGRHVETSAPVELIALEFASRRWGAGDAPLRQAIALSIDRAAINNVLLQRQGEPTGALLPQWLSGWAFLFPAAADLARAKELRPANAAPLALLYDASDPLARVVAERLAVNARDAGILIQVAANTARAPAPDARILRLRINSCDPAAALASLAPALDSAALPQILGAASPEALYAAERSLVDDFRLVPLVHLPEVYALGARVRNWDEPRAGGWPLNAVWLEPQRTMP